MDEPELLSAMRVAARQQALETSWDRIFEGMYEAYERCLSSLPVATADSRSRGTELADLRG
jgi:hypothetical protein